MTLSQLGAPVWLDHLIGALIALFAVSIFASSSSGVGVPRDESFYFYAADRSADWFERLVQPGVESFSRAEIDRGFKYNREHPVLMKNLFGLSHRLLTTRLGWVENHTLSYRLPTMVMAGLSLWLAWLLGIMVHGRIAGAVAVLALFLMPRFYFHAHLACFDAPVTFMWLLIAYTFLRASRSKGWAIACGVCLGLGFATKLNIFFLPFTLLLVAIVDCWAFKRRTGHWLSQEGTEGPITNYLWIACAMVVLGFLVFWLHWPWLYYDFVPRIREYIQFHARHEHYPVDYFGHLYYRPPFPILFPMVMTLVTVPLATLVLGGVGIWHVARQAWTNLFDHEEGTDRRSIDFFLLANLVVPLLIIAMPHTPIFGGTKHWMPAMPFLAVCAGVGAARIGQGLFAEYEESHQRWATLVLGVCLMVPAGLDTARYGAHGPTYFNVLAGGPSGAAALGLPRNFWGYSTVEILPGLNTKAEKGALVFWHKATRGAIDAYKRDGLLRRDITYTGDWTAKYSDWGVYHDQREKFPEEVDIWRSYGVDWPVDGFFIDGVQVMSVYQRPDMSERRP